VFIAFSDFQRSRQKPFARPDTRQSQKFASVGQRHSTPTLTTTEGRAPTFPSRPRYGFKGVSILSSAVALRFTAIALMPYEELAAVLIS
jgi:hypothetical protein